MQRVDICIRKINGNGDRESLIRVLGEHAQVNDNRFQLTYKIFVWYDGSSNLYTAHSVAPSDFGGTNTKLVIEHFQTMDFFRTQTPCLATTRNWADCRTAYAIFQTPKKNQIGPIGALIQHTLLELSAYAYSPCYHPQAKTVQESEGVHERVSNLVPLSTNLTTELHI